MRRRNVFFFICIVTFLLQIYRPKFQFYGLPRKCMKASQPFRTFFFFFFELANVVCIIKLPRFVLYFRLLNIFFQPQGSFSCFLSILSSVRTSIYIGIYIFFLQSLYTSRDNFFVSSFVFWGISFPWFVSFFLYLILWSCCFFFCVYRAKITLWRQS